MPSIRSSFILKLTWFSLFLQPQEVVVPIVRPAVDAIHLLPQSLVQFHNVFLSSLPLREFTINLPNLLSVKSLIL